MDHPRQQVVDSGKSTLENPKLKNFGVENYTSAKDLVRTFVLAIDTDSMNSKDQDEKGVPECQKQLILLNLNEVETSTNAQDAQVSRVSCAQERELDPWCTMFSVTAQLTRALTLVHLTSCCNSVRVPEKRHITRSTALELSKPIKEFTRKVVVSSIFHDADINRPFVDCAQSAFTSHLEAAETSCDTCTWSVLPAEPGGTRSGKAWWSWKEGVRT